MRPDWNHLQSPCQIATPIASPACVRMSIPLSSKYHGITFKSNRKFYGHLEKQAGISDHFQPGFQKPTTALFRHPWFGEGRRGCEGILFPRSGKDRPFFRYLSPLHLPSCSIFWGGRTAGRSPAPPGTLHPPSAARRRLDTERTQKPPEALKTGHLHLIAY